jgi:hypothetical protein
MLVVIARLVVWDRDCLTWQQKDFRHTSKYIGESADWIILEHCVSTENQKCPRTAWARFHFGMGRPKSLKCKVYAEFVGVGDEVDPVLMENCQISRSLWYLTSQGLIIRHWSICIRQTRNCVWSSSWVRVRAMVRPFGARPKRWLTQWISLGVYWEGKERQ